MIRGELLHFEALSAEEVSALMHTWCLERRDPLAEARLLKDNFKRFTDALATMIVEGQEIEGDIDVEVEKADRQWFVRIYRRAEFVLMRGSNANN